MKVKIQFFIFGVLLFGLADTVLADWDVNEIGRIPVLEYHRIDDGGDQYGRTPEQFRNDLLWLYNNNYYLIPVSFLVGQIFDVPAGKKPFMLVFDDSHPTQFWYQEDGSVDRDSAIGILDEFLKKHPDFGFGEMFFVNPGLFGQPEYKKKKLEYLLKTGRELGNHTVGHTNLRDLSIVEINRELGLLQGIVNEVSGRDLPMNTFAYPFGGVPKGEALMAAVATGSYEDVNYDIKAAFLVGADPTRPPYHSEYESLYVPRIQAIDEEWQRWFGRLPNETAQSDDSEIFHPFVSDGDAKVVSILSKDKGNLSYQTLAEGLKVCVLDEGECVYSQKSGRKSFKYGDDVAVKTEDTKQQKTESKDSGEIVAVEPEIVSEPIERGSFMRGVWATRTVISDWLYKTNPAIYRADFKKALGLPHVRLSFNLIPDELKWDGANWVYLVREGDVLSAIVEKFYDLTPYFLTADFKDEIIAKNPLEDGLKPGMELIIPAVEMLVWDIVPNLPYKAGIYWTGYTAGSANGQNLADKLVEAGGNAVVFDVKDVEGLLFYDSRVPLVLELDAVSARLPNVYKLVRNLHQRGLYVIARMTLFKDHALANGRKDLAVVRASSGQPWTYREGLWWVDPSHPEVVQHNLDLVREVAAFGVDEIQFDYIRFPAEGDAEDTRYWYETNAPHLKSKQDVIVDFLRQARVAVSDYDVALSADLFGVVAWNDGVDGLIVGQDIQRMGEYLDAIYPMIYPSHFGPGFAGKADPANEAYFFVQESTKKFIKLVEGTQTEIRPWIQGFSLGVDNFGAWYVQEQVDSLRDIGVHSFMIWSAANNYEPAWGVF